MRENPGYSRETRKTREKKKLSCPCPKPLKIGSASTRGGRLNCPR